MRSSAIVVGLTLALFTWTRPGSAQPISSARGDHTAAKPDREHRTPEQQLWCAVLDSSLAEAKSLDPAMRAFLLQSIASGMAKCDSKQVRSILIDAFRATLELPENQEDIDHELMREDTDHESARTLVLKIQTKEGLQNAALKALLAIDEAEVERFLPQAENDVATQTLGEMISRATAAKRFDRAIRLLDRIAPGQRFPYSEATELMFQLPPERDSDKQEIFQRALVSDKESPSLTIGGGDFAAMIVRFWQHLPPSLVLEAIHQSLEGSRSLNSQIALSSPSGKVSFNDSYEYRLFELFPILEQLDKAEAEKLLSDSREAKNQLQQFPQGVQSLDPTIRDTPLGKEEHSSMTGGMGMDNNPALQAAEIAHSYDSRATEIGRMAVDNPRQAIAAAATLPDAIAAHAPRAQALLSVARVAMKKQPAAAKSALEAMAESLKRTDPSTQSSYWDQSSIWAEGIDIAKEIGELDLAGNFAKLGTQQAEKLRSKDTDPDDPNLALEAYWPSSIAMVRMMVAASHLSPRTALDSVRQLGDLDLRVICDVKLANEGLGARSLFSETMVSKKSSVWSSETVE